MENIERTHPTREYKKGNQNCNWKGGIAEYKNHYQMKLNRLEKLKQTKGKCEVCGKNGNEIHHKDSTTDNHNISNLMLLCRKDHILIHKLNRANKPYTSKWKRKYGMSLREIAEKTGISEGYVFNLLSGRVVSKKHGMTKKQLLKEAEIYK